MRLHGAIVAALELYGRDDGAAGGVRAGAAAGAASSTAGPAATVAAAAIRDQLRLDAAGGGYQSPSP